MTTGRDSLMRAVCLLSGSGTNLQAILDNISAKKIKLAMTSVISETLLQWVLKGLDHLGLKPVLLIMNLMQKKKVTMQLLKNM